MSLQWHTQTIINMTSTLPRKKPRTVKCPMPANGACPFPDCGWVCKSKNMSTFAMHITKKHATEMNLPAPSYQCSVCAEQFTCRGDLRQHTVKAHEPRKWECPDCPYVAKNKSTLITHVVRKHKGYHYDKDCVTDSGTCVHCHQPRPATGHIYHMGVCLGVAEAVTTHNRR